MIALVTGGAGFIGSHLVKELVRRKYKVIVLDNLSTGSLENLKFVKNKIKFIKFDLSKNKKISKYLKGVDYVFHLAGLISVEDSLKHPNKYYLTNLMIIVMAGKCIKTAIIRAGAIGANRYAMVRPGASSESARWNCSFRY